MLNSFGLYFEPRADEFALCGIICCDISSSCSSSSAFSSLSLFTVCRNYCLSFLSSSSSCLTFSSSSLVLLRFADDFIKFDALPFSTAINHLRNEDTLLEKLMQLLKAAANSGRISIIRLRFSSRRSFLSFTASLIIFFELDPVHREEMSASHLRSMWSQSR
jgi:hypothetical protein